MMDELTIALLTSGFWQVWARYDCVQRVAQNRIRLWATCCTKSHMTHTTLGKMTTLCNMQCDGTLGQNCIRLWAGLEKIRYDATNLKSHMHLSGSRKFWKIGKSLLYIS